jgi:hypothetical protein
MISAKTLQSLKVSVDSDVVVGSTSRNPMNIPMSYNLYLASTRSVINKTTDRLAIESFMQSFTEVRVFIYPAISFYSNALASQTFRNEFFHLFSWIFTCGHKERVRNRRRIGPSTITVMHAKRNVLPMVVIN